MISLGNGRQQPLHSYSTITMSVFKELEHRKKCQSEEWDTQLLYRFSEEQCVKKLDCNVRCIDRGTRINHSVHIYAGRELEAGRYWEKVNYGDCILFRWVSAAFCMTNDVFMYKLVCSKCMASGHLTHEIAICRMIPKICHIRTLAGHSRTPWCLSFDPWQPHILYSGCLAGTVHKWDVRVSVYVITRVHVLPFKSCHNYIYYNPWSCKPTPLFHSDGCIMYCSTSIQHC